MTNLEKKILSEAISSFELVTGYRLSPYITHDNIDIELRSNEIPISFSAQVVPIINKTKIGLIKNQLNQFHNIPLIITQFVNKELSALLKELNINFIDTAGNAFINVSPLFIFINGNRKTVQSAKSIDSSKKAKYKKASLQLIFTLLCNPGFEKNPYREIAEYAKIGLGTVQLYMSQLEKDGFLNREGKYGIELINKEELFHLWVEDYPQQIQLKYLIGRYEIKSQKIDIENNLNKFNALLGGESAAAKITSYLRPFTHTIYIKSKVGEFILTNGLKKNKYGNILLHRKFWNFDDDNSQYNLVPDMLIYADLISSGDPRNIETANIIYETRIIEYLR
ncbi:MAG: hypothetical protein HND52_07555 [Ignavibacteriae bacterium]|nr:hypothetical protein [Ignavibacteriota bacterium]NOG97801.1 hypothetical protein [Ignavibacteriota bacterium]